MKILACYIENYGKIQNRTINFSDELNIIKEDNGWGKTTLASFIKSMFYGVPDNRGNDISGNERKKYMPWNGAKFGGNITFETNKTQYRLERFFGKKPNEDSFALYNAQTNKITQDYDENIGENLFGINKDSYERSTYIPQNSVVLDGLSNDINTRLLNLINDTDDKHSFDYAEKRLRAAEKEIAPKRKEGKIDFVNSNIEKLLIQIEDYKIYKERLKEKCSELEKLGEKLTNNVAELNVIEEKIQFKNTENEKSANASHYNELKASLTKALDKQKILSDFFNGRDETTINTAKISNNLEKANSLEKAIHSIELDIGQLKSQQIELAANRKNIETELDSKNTTKENLESKNVLLIEKKDALLSRKNSPHLTAVAPPTTTVSTKPSSKYIIILAIATLMIICGIIGCLFILGLGIALISTGVLSLAICGVLWLKKYIDFKAGFSPSSQIFQTPQDTAILQLDITTAETEINDNVNKISDSINKILQLKKSLEELPIFDCSLLAAKEVELEDKKKELEEITAIINDEYSQYNFTNNDWAGCLALLNTNIAESAEIVRYIAEINHKIKDFTKDKNENDYILSEKIHESIDVLISRKSQLQDERNTINKNIIEAQKSIEFYENSISDTDTLEGELELQQETLAKLETKLSTIQKTIKYLTESKDLLASKYLQPLMLSSQTYISDFDSSNIMFKLDSDTKILIEEQGQNHSLDFYSTGYREFISLCTRLALVDTIFTKEKPPIILDDPFTNLDEAKLTQAKNLIKNLSKQHQIIYFTCHSSRQLKI